MKIYMSILFLSGMFYCADIKTSDSQREIIANSSDDEGCITKDLLCCCNPNVIPCCCFMFVHKWLWDLKQEGCSCFGCCDNKTTPTEIKIGGVVKKMGDENLDNVKK